MKSILLIGLGRFGRHIAMNLNDLNQEVMAVDHNEERINAILPFVTNAQIGDSTNEEFLSSLGVRNYDACIVAIGDDFQSSLETASLLKELGARKVIARASTEVQEKFLLRNGADEVVYPENSWLPGLPSAAPRSIFWTISNWTRTTPSLSWLSLRSGGTKPLSSWISVKNTVSIFWVSVSMTSST